MTGNATFAGCESTGTSCCESEPRHLICGRGQRHDALRPAAILSAVGIFVGSVCGSSFCANR